MAPVMLIILLYSCRYVVNYDFPHHIEDYVHRVGRTGRAGYVGWLYQYLNILHMYRLLNSDLQVGNRDPPYVFKYIVLHYERDFLITHYTISWIPNANHI